MTKEQDEANAKQNEVIRACEHDPIRHADGGIRCAKCGVVFATMMLARLATPLVYDEADEE